jgi:ubiquinone/menaquinone biosynthesis C-methylase UbiE
MNAKNLGFHPDSFDIALCGFMGWDDCFDFVNFKFTRPDTKAHEIWRVLRSGGKFVCCSWDEQEDVAWMEEAMLRYYPAILKDRKYLEQHPIGMAYEKAQGYEVIFRNAGFSDIEISTQSMTFISTDEEEWWRQMQHLGWGSFIDRIGADELQRIKEAVFKDLQSYKRTDGIHFKKVAFFVCGVK